MTCYITSTCLYYPHRHLSVSWTRRLLHNFWPKYTCYVDKIYILDKCDHESWWLSWQGIQWINWRKCILFLFFALYSRLIQWMGVCWQMHLVIDYRLVIKYASGWLIFCMDLSIYFWQWHDICIHSGHQGTLLGSRYT